MVDPVQYEFDPSQDELIADLAKKMGFVAILLIVGGIIAIVGGLLGLFTAPPPARGSAFGSLVQGVFSLLVGNWTRGAAAGFKRIAETEGRDIENLMGALGKLRNLYGLQYWLAIVALILLALSIIATLILGIAS